MMMKFKSTTICQALVLVGLVIFCATWNLVEVEAKRKPKSACINEECLLSPQHFALYSNIKKAIDSKFNIKGKEIYPLLNSVETLRLRYGSQDPSLRSNESRLVQSLISSPYLVESLKSFGSPTGRMLVDLYRAPINGRQQNLACHKLRIEDIERASKILASDRKLDLVFSNIHKNFIKKSAKKCLRRSCSSIDLAMSRLDYMYKPKHNKPTHVTDEDIDNSIGGSSNDSRSTTGANPHYTLSNSPATSREFESQELELCKFFKTTNDSSSSSSSSSSDCYIGGRQLSDIKLTGNDKVNISQLVDAYYSGKQSRDASVSMATKSQLVLDQCRPLKPLLEHNLTGLKWYNRMGFIDKNDLITRSTWCPKLSYWLELDRLCSELETLLAFESPARATTSKTVS